MDRCFMAGLAYWLGLREIGCGIVRTGVTSPMLVLEMIQRVQPTALVAVPSFLRVIADKARETGFDLAACSVKKAICIGEPIRDSVLVLNPSGRAIETRRAVPPLSVSATITRAFTSRATLHAACVMASGTLSFGSDAVGA